jgi:hypothetical protein
LSGSITTPATLAVWASEHGTTVDLSARAAACFAVIVLQAPTVGAPKSGPSGAPFWACDGAAETVSAVAAATAARVPVKPEIVMDTSCGTQAC